MINIAEPLKYKKNINFGAYYFIVPDDVPLELATYSDLILIQAKGFGDIDIRPDYYPEGIKISGHKAKYNEQGEYAPITVSGIAIFESIDGTNKIKIDDEIFIRHSYSTPGKKVCFEFIPLNSVRDKYVLKYIFSVSKRIKISITASGDVLFNSEKEAEKFSRFLTFYGGELNKDGVMIVVNEKCIHYFHYDVFVDDEQVQMTHEELFDYLGTICPENIKQQPYYQRSFRIKPNWYEIVPVC